MKRKYTLLIAAMVLAVCLAGCSSRNNSGGTNSNNGANTNSPSVSPDHNTELLPGNDADEGGGAGGTSDENGSLFDDTHNDRNDWVDNNNDGHQNDDHNDPLDDMLDGVGNAVDDIGNAVGDAIDGNDNGTNHNSVTGENSRMR